MAQTVKSHHELPQHPLDDVRVEETAPLRLILLELLPEHRSARRCTKAFKWLHGGNTTQERSSRRTERKPAGIENFGLPAETGQELRHFLVSRTEGEALEVVRGAERVGPEALPKIGCPLWPIGRWRQIRSSSSLGKPQTKTKSVLETSWPRT